MSKDFNQSVWGGGDYKPGDNYAICDICGFKLHASKLRYNYNGLLVCSADWEPQHPQEKIKQVKEKITPDKVRVEGDDNYISVANGNVVTADDL